MTDIPSSGEEIPSAADSTPSVTTVASSGLGVRPLLLVGAALFGAVIVAYAVALVFAGGGIPRGTSVAGVDVGGLSHDEAVAHLESELEPRVNSFVVSVDGAERRIAAQRAGLQFDAVATIDSIEPRSYNPFVLVQQLWSTEVQPVVVADEERLDKVVAKVSRRVDVAVREGKVRYDGLDIVTVNPRPGVALDREAAKQAIASGYVSTDGPIALPLEPVLPTVTAEQVDAVAGGDAVEAISAPITLSAAGTEMTLDPEEIAESVVFRPVAGELGPVVRTQVARELLADDLGAIGRPARDASFDTSSGKPVVVPARDGRGVTDSGLQTGISSAVLGSPRSAQLSLGTVPAELTTADARGLGVKRVISTFTQPFPYAAYRVTNIGIAARKINGTVLRPGDEFSMNGIVGERTPENGFVKGYIIVGNRLVEDYGGAVSTITTASWHTAFYAGMTRLEQRAHGFWIPRYLPGLEATVSWGNLDLRFRNDTPYGVLVTSSVTDTSVTVTMWSTKYWDITAQFGPRTNPRPAGTVFDDSDDCVAQVGVDGFDITVTRVWKRNGEVKRREPLDTSYDAAPTVLCQPEPTPEPKPTKSPKPKPTKSGGSGSGGSGGGGSGGGGSGGGGSGGGGSGGGGSG